MYFLRKKRIYWQKSENYEHINKINKKKEFRYYCCCCYFIWSGIVVVSFLYCACSHRRYYKCTYKYVMAMVRPSSIDRDGILASGALYKYLLYVYITLHTTYSIPTSPIRFFFYFVVFFSFFLLAHTFISRFYYYSVYYILHTKCM